MAYLTIKPTRFDKQVASVVSNHTNRRLVKAASIATWAADEHVLLVAAVAGWLLTRRSAEETRRLGTHFFVCSMITALLPHVLKNAVDQERPDRLTIDGHIRGVPWSGRANDAFPSGHALHLGALTSAPTLLNPSWRTSIWTFSVIVASTRVILLAHWVTDVLAGFAIGTLVERSVRLLTRPSQK